MVSLLLTPTRKTLTKRRQRNNSGGIGQVHCFSLFLIALGFLPAQYVHHNKPQNRPMAPSVCRISPVRREWRSLSQSEKAEYVDAVICLRTIPSRIRPEGVLYDDFPYIHARVAKHSMTPSTLEVRRYKAHQSLQPMALGLFFPGIAISCIFTKRFFRMSATTTVLSRASSPPSAFFPNRLHQRL